MITKISVPQVEWLLRRDFFYCNFSHEQSGPFSYFCRDEYFDVYQIGYLPYLGLLERIIPIHYRFLTVCKHHFAFMVKFGYKLGYDKRLYEIAKINSKFYEIHAPEDPFPKNGSAI